MIERCIVCHLKFVEQEKAERFPQVCGTCIQKAELEATKQDRKPPITSSENILAVLEQTFRKSFGGKQEKARLKWDACWIARGRDAADAAISSTFGPNTLKSFKVRTDEVSEG